MKLYRSLLLSLMTFLFLQSYCQSSDWLTFYEKSGGLATPGYNETIDFVRRLDSQSNELYVEVFGKSPQQRDLIYAVYDRDGFTNPEEIRKKGRVILMVEACIHAGESEGKDAMLLLLRDLIINKTNETFFTHVSVVFIPIFNVDGHERFGKFGRINQNGPVEMGWRTTAQNLNLNRDFLKADAPEMKSWLQLFNRWQPDFFIDTHTTDGADYQYVLTYGIETGENMDENLNHWQTEVFLPFVNREMEQKNMPIFPYVYFRNWHDPRSGLLSGVAGPMFSQGYTGTRNRPGLLIETHMLKPYNQRVEATKEIILASIQLLNQEHQQLSNLIEEADIYTSSKEFRKKPFATRYMVDMNDSIFVTFKGFDYEVKNSDLTGGEWFVYDNQKPVEMELPMFDHNKPTLFVNLPEAYVIPAEWHDIIERLQYHGVRMTTLAESKTLGVETYVFTSVDWQKTSYEGRFRLTKMEFETKKTNTLFPKGSMIVPMNQPLAKVIAHLLEPRGNGSLVEWGFFNQIFEQKEYAESYVMEPMARKMLDSIPGLKSEFELKKQNDSVFAKDAWEQLNWFYSKTPWWDQKYMVYPIGRIVE